MPKQTQKFDPLKIPLPGVHSINASAGTGKTYTITTLYLRYLLEAGCHVDQILVTTFTKAATAELKERIRKRLSDAVFLVRSCESDAAAEELVQSGDADAQVVALLKSAGAWNAEYRERVNERLEDAILSFDQAPIYTIDSFCQRVLQLHVFETGSRFQFEVLTSQDDLCEDAVRDFVANRWGVPDSKVADWLPFNSTLWSLLLEVAKQAINHPVYGVQPDGSSLGELLDSPELRTFKSKAQVFSEVWQRDRAEIESTLRKAIESGCLNQRSYKANQIEETLAFLDLFAKSPSFHLLEWDTSKGEVESHQSRLAQNKLEAGTKKGKETDTPHHAAFELIQELLEQAARVRGIGDTLKPQLLAQLAAYVRERVSNYKREHGLMSFGDLQLRVDDALSGALQDALIESLSDRYRVALVDEFQDTDPIQFRIFERIFLDGAEEQPVSEDGMRAFVIIGDPKQSIYRFRGADIHSYLAANQRVPAKQRHEMGTNWRSDRSLVDAVQAVFKSVGDPFLNAQIGLPEIKAHHPDRLSAGDALIINLVPRSPFVAADKEPSNSDALKVVVQRVAADIVHQLNSQFQIPDGSGGMRALSPGDIAVLCRSGVQLRAIQQELAQRLVPAVLYTDESVYETPEAEFMSRILAALLKPSSLTLMANALCTPLFGLLAEDLAELPQQPQALAHWAEKFHLWSSTWHRDGFIVMWRGVLDDSDAIRRLAQQTTGERQITNYLHLSELLHQQAASSHSGPDELFRWFEQLRANPAGSDDESQLRLETDAAAVQLVTIHKSKGLEYPVVYCPTLWSAFTWRGTPQYLLAEDGGDEGLPVIDVGSELFDDRLERSQNEQAAEDRRLLYVALTRARHQCHIHWTAAKGAKAAAAGMIVLGDLEGPEPDHVIEQQLQRWAGSLGVPRVHVNGVAVAQGVRDPGQLRWSQGIVSHLSPRVLRREHITALVQTSYTSLTRFADHVHVVDDADRDAVTLDRSLDVVRPERSEDLSLLAAMPGGTAVGDAVHRIFEAILLSGEYRASNPAALQEKLAQRFEIAQRRLDIEPRWHGPLLSALQATLTQPIASLKPPAPLLDVPVNQLACEMPFVLPLGNEGLAFRMDRLAAGFEHSERPIVQRYAERVRRLAVAELQGFLTGFIDLVFEWQGRWYVLDYKTTNLGPRIADYDTHGLETGMSDHDYILQYHLYCAAVERFLKQRLPDFDFARDFGGVLYLFLRGVDPDARELGGAFFDCPSARVMETLQLALHGQ